ncbi:PRC-barrel domain-containing protein [Microvirga sp. P5_D2]
MLKKHMAACLVVTAFAAVPTLAQTSTTPSAPTDRPAASGAGSTTSGSPAMQPGVASPSTTSSSMNSTSASPGQFMTQMKADQVLASDLIGTRVVSTNNESIGDINDVIVDRNGQVMAAVVGVGGFLGIGEKNVAVPFNSLEFANAQQADAMDSNKSVTTTGSTAAGTTAAPGTAGTSTTKTTSSASANEPDRVVLRMTKAELQAAPAFDKDGDDKNATTTGKTGASGTTTTAPKP